MTFGTAVLFASVVGWWWGTATGGVGTAAAASYSTTTSCGRLAAATPPRRRPPPFLSHVTTETMAWALGVAEARHQAAVALALTHYPVDDPENVDSRDDTSRGHETEQRTTEPPATCEHTDAAVRWQSHPLGATALPDYDAVIPATVAVTEPPLLSRDECAAVVQAAEEYFATTAGGVWPRQRSGQYEVAGFYLHQVPAVRSWFQTVVRTKVFPLLAQTFPDFCPSPTDLCVDQAYMFKYTPATGRRTDVHTDSGCLSFTMALNPKAEYEGGGTWFQGLQNSNNENNKGGVIEMDMGQVTVRPGGVKHCGYPVTSGTRYIIGGFCMHRTKVEPVRMLLSSSSSTISSSEQELALLEAATVLNPACDAAYNMLANHYDAVQGNKAKAQQVLEYCLEHVHDSSAEVAFSLSSLYMAKGLFQKAIDCLQICLQVDDSDVDAMMGMAQAAAAMGDPATEESYYNRIVETPGVDKTVAASAYCNLGVLHQDEESELAYYRQCLELVPDNFAARYSLACALASRKEWAEAVKTFKQAIATLEDVPEDSQNCKKALESLYTATSHMLQSQGDRPTSREEMMQRFQDSMGAENFAKMAATQGQK